MPFVHLQNGISIDYTEEGVSALKDGARTRVICLNVRQIMMLIGLHLNGKYHKWENGKQADQAWQDPVAQLFSEIAFAAAEHNPDKELDLSPYSMGLAPNRTTEFYGGLLVVPVTPHAHLRLSSSFLLTWPQEKGPGVSRVVWELFMNCLLVELFPRLWDLAKGRVKPSPEIARSVLWETVSGTTVADYIIWWVVMPFCWIFGKMAQLALRLKFARDVEYCRSILEEGLMLVQTRLRERDVLEDCIQRKVEENRRRNAAEETSSAEALRKKREDEKRALEAAIDGARKPLEDVLAKAEARNEVLADQISAFHRERKGYEREIHALRAEVNKYQRALSGAVTGFAEGSPET